MPNKVRLKMFSCFTSSSAGQSPRYAVFCTLCLPLLLGFIQVTYCSYLRNLSEHDKNGGRTKISFHIVKQIGNAFSANAERKQAFLPVGAGGLIDSGTANTSSVCPAKKLVMAYYPDWVGDTFPPEKIEMTRFDWIDFAFAVPNSTFGLTWDEPKKGPDLLKRLVNRAHAHGTKVKLSLGGWTGSKYFSNAVATEQSRATFASNILAAYKTFDLDGIDIDWEYPGRPGAPGNKWHPNDAKNFLSLIQLLRTVLPPAARISAAVDTTTFIGNHGKPMSNVSEFSKVLDWALIMNYDVWGTSSKPGPNAPLQDVCGNSTQPGANAVSAFNAWTSAHFPACKLVLGLPSYGYISSSTAGRLRTRAKSSKVKKVKVKSQPSGTFLKVVNEDGGSDGQVQFKELLRQGALVRSTPTLIGASNVTSFIGGGGFERRWDSCSETPFLRSNASRQVITYDDLESLRLKVAFAKEVGMLGINLFDIHGDTDNWDLTDCIREALGLA